MFHFYVGEQPSYSSYDYAAWIAEVRDPDHWRAPEQEFEVEADYGRPPVKGQLLPSIPAVEESRSGFSIAVKPWGVVRVELEQWQFVVRVRGSRHTPVQRTGLVQSQALARAVIEGVRSLSETYCGIHDDDEEILRQVVRRQRRRLLALVPSRVLGAQGAALRASGRVGWLARQPEFYAHRHIVNDVLRYRAAAIALSGCGEDECEPRRKIWDAPLSECGREVSGRVLPEKRRAGDLKLALGAMSNWRALYSPSSDSYGSLDRTLMNLPTEVPSAWLPRLRHARLRHAALSAAELNLVLSAIQLSVGFDGSRSGDAPLLAPALSACEAEIVAAMAKVSVQASRELDQRCAADVESLAEYLDAWPRREHDTLGRIVSNAIRWNQGQCEPEEVIELLGLGKHRLTSIPPLPPPAEKGIHFLGSVGEVVAEALRMQHCVAYSAGAAVAGAEYLFHVVNEGERATVSVTSRGYVRQVCGPRNAENAATRWGRVRFEAWAGELREERLSLAVERSRGMED